MNGSDHSDKQYLPFLWKGQGGGGVLDDFQVRLDLFYLIGVVYYIRVISSLYFIYILDEAVIVGLALA